jgi:hypothetical protein
MVDMNYAVNTEGKAYLPEGHFDKSVDLFSCKVVKEVFPSLTAVSIIATSAPASRAICGTSKGFTERILFESAYPVATTLVEELHSLIALVTFRMR